MRTQPGTSLTYSLVEALGQAIVTGEFVAAGFPTEAEVSKRFGASRTVTREAVKMLTAKGLLSARPRHGTVVEPEAEWNMLDPDVLRWLLERKFSLRLLTEFTEMRLGLEPAAAALAARNADEAGLEEIRRGLRRMKAAARGEDDALAADIAFHIAILSATQNPFYRELHELVNTALRISIRFTNRIKGRTASIPSHEDVAEAIIARDADKASAAMREIILDVLELVRSASDLAASDLAASPDAVTG
ncbi:FadR/GntR family transcriptional regulator [Caulobacter sp. FWC2]|uniref:FadR/GntR family transcriptional regulator n=1 Tax=Caulobacter sp. FWC2 TaxID=69664 RepID=UPI000C156094|nr:FadR/GntR family transcriptional regulator [Caulobacter sp. FWC2]PIB93861.1 FadR family transcriptional regulator [Caulobacter sp. FWC2]